MLDLYFFVHVHFNIFIVFFQLDWCIVIEENNHILFYELHELPLQSCHVDGEIKITMKLSLQHGVVNIRNAINFDS